MHGITKAAAVPALFFTLVSHASAQSGPATVAFIMFGFDESKKSDTYGEGFNETGNKLAFRDSWGNDLAITQVDNCKYTVSGTRFLSDHRGPVEFTLDFSRMQSQWREGAISLNNKFYYIHIDGVRVCSKAVLGVEHFERLPPPGQCWSYLESKTYTEIFRNDGRRIVAALNHMQQAYCKGSAY